MVFHLQFSCSLPESGFLESSFWMVASQPLSCLLEV